MIFGSTGCAKSPCAPVVLYRSEGSYSECTALIVTINVGSDHNLHVTVVGNATYIVLYRGISHFQHSAALFL
jgi:hypothetical protein